MAGISGDTAVHGPANSRTMSAEEALRIRRVLTLYLASLITFPTENPSHLQLCSPDTALEVLDIPKEVAGLRRQYLKEVQANIKVRQDYQNLLAITRSGDANVTTRTGEADGGSTKLETHLKLLQMRKRHKEVQIIRHCLEKLKETNPAKDGGLDFKSPQLDGEELPQVTSVEGINGADGHGENTKALMDKLERVVVGAKYSLEREQRLLAEVKARHATDSSQDRVIDPEARVAALSATRDELVRFLEEKMLNAAVEDEDVPGQVAEKGSELASDREQVQKQIRAEYGRYIGAREMVLESAVKALYPSQAPGSENTSTFTHEDSKEAENRNRALASPAGQSNGSLLPFVAEQVLPLLQNQNVAALQNSYTTRVINTERAKALDNLERLADESHLLPAYPIMARQERFKNVAAAFGAQRKLDQGMVGPEESDKITRRVEAWAFAAEEAAKAEEYFVVEKIRHGNERLDKAGESLAVLAQMLGSDQENSELGGEDNGEADIWLEAAGADQKKAQSQRLRPSRLEQGPWAGLNGKIGVVDKKKY